MDKLPISALVVSYNEGFLLEDCLDSIQFCDEIVVIDLKSNDNTLQIANKMATSAFQEDKVELVEHLFPQYIPQLKHDWVMLIDPDERIDRELKEDIFGFFKDIPADCGKINVPIQYYYKHTALKGTVWGGNNKTGRLLIRKSACTISGNVHTAVQLKEGFITYRITRKGNNIDHHYWVQSFDQMLEKHKRYTLKEGKSKYDKGERFSYLRLFNQSFQAFRESYFTCKGYSDGFLGFFLSSFYAWYIWSSWLSLKKYQKDIKNGLVI
jgi:glycosyltransferase involved in cell wall biosynthesis